MDDFDSPKSIKEKDVPVKLEVAILHHEQGRDRQASDGGSKRTDSVASTKQPYKLKEEQSLQITRPSTYYATTPVPKEDQSPSVCLMKLPG